MARGDKPAGEGDETPTPGPAVEETQVPTVEELEATPVEELREQAEESGRMPEEGSGKEGAVIKADLVEALKPPPTGVERTRAKLKGRPPLGDVGPVIAVITTQEG